MTETATRKLSFAAEIGTAGWGRTAERTATLGQVRGIGSNIPNAVADLAGKVTAWLNQPRRPSYVRGPQNEKAVVYWDGIWCYDLLDALGYFYTVSGYDTLAETERAARRELARRHAGRTHYLGNDVFEELAAYLDDPEEVEALARDYGFQRAYVAGKAQGVDDPHLWAIQHEAEYRPAVPVNDGKGGPLTSWEF